MGEQVRLADISKSVHRAGLTADCALGHVLYAYAMGWTEAPVPGTEHGAFTRLKAIRVLRQFPEWPNGWEAQLSRVTHSLRRPVPTSEEADEDMTPFRWVTFLAIVVPMVIWFYLKDLLED